jgi:hypothetical protein
MANKISPDEPFAKQKKKLTWLDKLILKVKGQ